MYIMLAKGNKVLRGRAPKLPTLNVVRAAFWKLPYWHSCTEDKSQYVGRDEGHWLNFKMFGTRVAKYGGEKVP